MQHHRKQMLHYWHKIINIQIILPADNKNNSPELLFDMKDNFVHAMLLLPVIMTSLATWHHCGAGEGELV